MIIKIKDIPLSGREVSFELEIDPLNQRIVAAELGEAKIADPAAAVFFAPVRTEIALESKGTTIIIKGHVFGQYMTGCSRCAEEIQQEISTQVDIILQPKQDDRADDDSDEDVAYGFYEGKEIDCAIIVEEFLILALPYTTQCSDKCKGLCPTCGQNLNNVQCECVAEGSIDPRLAALKDIRIKH